MTDVQQNKSTTSSGGSGTGAVGDNRNQKLRGAVEVIHGVGENLRGRFMDAVDSSTKTRAGPGGGPRPEVEQGRLEVEQGMAKLTGGPGVTNAPPTSRTNPIPRATQAPSAPLAHEGNGLGPASSVNADPEAAVAQGPYQPQYAPSGAGSDGTAAFQQGSTNRDFRPSPAVTFDQPQGAGSTPGPAPGRNTLSSGPQRLG
ncbi:hypothetical protein C8Q79DRAFT_121798 [Trametes meyenii]|nr:hypothetical protein C8Q79DRAFT_121798 [Trametes meyenii]